MIRARQRAEWHRIGIFLFAAVLVVIADQVSKLWIRNHLDFYEIIQLTSHLSLTYLSNTGAAFGLFTNQAFVLSLVAVFGLILILLMFHHYLPKLNILITLAIGLVFGGAIGNLVDRFCLGHVIDFIYVRLWRDFYWPAFNVADSAITVGVITLACLILLMLKKEDGHYS